MTVFSDNAEWSGAAATVAAKPAWRGGGGRGEGEGERALVIIKLQIGITL